MTIIIFALNKKYKPMQIVNIEAGTFTEMVSALQSLKNKMGKLQEVYSEKKMDEWLDNCLLYTSDAADD